MKQAIKRGKVINESRGNKLFKCNYVTDPKNYSWTSSPCFDSIWKFAVIWNVRIYYLEGSCVGLYNFNFRVQIANFLH